MSSILDNAELTAERIAQLRLEAEQAILGIDTRSLAFNAPAYRVKANRFDPFDPEYLLSVIGLYSPFLFRPIFTIEDSVLHSTAICEKWQEEDSEYIDRAGIYREKWKEREEALKNTPGTREYEVERARIAWKEAVAQRKDIVRQWDVYVAACRDRYRSLRESAASKSAKETKARREMLIRSINDGGDG